MRLIAAIVALAAVLIVAGTSRAEPAGTDAVDPQTGLPVLDEVLITGSQPGPGMWRISSDQHTLWLLGTISPLPRRMQWNSADVEAAIVESQQVIGPPSIRFEGIGLVRGLFLLPALLGARKNPDGQRLADVLPPALYARWQEAKSRHLPRNRAIEGWRPVFAVQKLYQEAVESLGLRFGGVVWPVVESTAKRNDVEIVTPTLELTLAEPRQAIRAFSRSALDDLECFQLSLDRLELDLGNARARAVAWAEGDLERIAGLSLVDPGPACIEAVLNSSVISAQGLADLPQRMRAAWLQAVDTALANNAQTFAILPMDFLFGPDGALASLEQRGYSVEAPE